MTNILSFLKQITSLSEAVEDDQNININTVPESDYDEEDSEEEDQKKKHTDDLRIRVYASLTREGFSDARPIIWHEFPYSSNKTTRIVLDAINEGITTYNTQLNKNAPLLELDPTFVSNAEVAFAKLYIHYCTWEAIIDEALFDGYSFESALKTARNIYTTSDLNLRLKVKSYVWPFFKHLNPDLQERIKTASDITGLKTILNIRENSDISILMSNILQSSLLEDRKINDVTEISTISLQAVRRSIVREILKFTTDPTYTWDRFSKATEDSFWGEKEETQFQRISRKKDSSFDFLTSVDNKDTIDNTSPTKDSRNDRDEDMDASFGVEPSIPSSQLEQEIQDNFIVSSQGNEIQTRGASFHLTGINKFTDISDINLLLLIEELIILEYIGKQDVIALPPRVPETKITHGSLFKWLSQGSSEIVSNKCTTDFINLFSDNILTSSSGTSLPISEEKRKLLDGRVNAFAMAYNITSLQNKLDAVQAQQKREEQAKNEVSSNFFDQVEKLVSSESIFSSDIKRDIINDIASIKTSQDIPSVKYLKTIESIFNHSGNSKAAYSISSVMTTEKNRVANPEYTTFPKIVASFVNQREPAISLSYISGIPAMQKLGLKLPVSTYPPVETLMFASPDTIQGLLDQLELIPVTQMNKKNHDTVQVKLEKLLKFKTTGNILEAHAKVSIPEIPYTGTNKNVRSIFIDQCLPIMDAVVTDARYLLYFVRNLTHSNFKIVQQLWDPEDVRNLDKAVWKKIKRNLQETELNNYSITEFIASFKYNKDRGNTTAYQQNLYPEDIPKLQKLINIIQDFITLRLRSDPKVDKVKLDTYKDALLKLSYLISESVRDKQSELPNLDPIKQFLREYETEIVQGLRSKKGTQNATTKLIQMLVITNYGTCIGIYKTDPDDVEKEQIADKVANQGAAKQLAKIHQREDDINDPNSYF